MAWHHKHPICEQLRKVRELEGLSQKQLAGITGISRGTLNKLESGQHLPNISTIADLAYVMGWELKLVPKQRCTKRK